MLECHAIDRPEELAISRSYAPLRGREAVRLAWFAWLANGSGSRLRRAEDFNCVEQTVTLGAANFGACRLRKLKPDATIRALNSVLHRASQQLHCVSQAPPCRPRSFLATKKQRTRKELHT